MERSGGHVLIVEDNPYLTRLLRRILSLHGFRCEDAQNERSALQTISAMTLAVVADIDLSETGGSRRGGIILAETLSETARIPVILISQTPWHHFASETIQGSDGWKKKHHVRAILNRGDDDFAERLCDHLRGICEV